MEYCITTEPVRVLVNNQLGKMTKEELKQVESFLEDMFISDDDIEVLYRAWEWLRQKYHTEGKKKLKDYNQIL